MIIRGIKKSFQRQTWFGISKTATILAFFGLCYLLLVAGAAGAQSSLAGDQLTPRAQLTLNRNVTVNGTKIRLSDIFSGVSQQKDRDILSAPLPGRRLTIDAREMQAYLQRNELAWNNENGVEEIQVKRNSETVSEDVVKSLLKDMLSREKNVHLEELDVQLTTRVHNLHMPIAAKTGIQIERLTYTGSNDHFEAIISYPDEMNSTATARVMGRAVQVQMIPVLTKHIARGSTIASGDVTWSQIEVRRMSPNTLVEIEQIVGKEARRSLRTDRPLLVSDLTEPMLVRKGEMITMIYEVPGMTLSDMGRAMESGAIGDVVSVLNPRSKQTVMAKVTAKDRVTVSMNQLAMN